MMVARILIIQGHPDCDGHHLCHALAQAYADGARAGGHTVDQVEPGRLDFPLLRSAEQWQHDPVPPALALAQEATDNRNPLKAGLLHGRSARVVVTMGMPAPVYRWFYRAHSLKSLQRNILGFAGIKPVRSTLVGSAAAMTQQRVERCCARMRSLGAAAR